MDYKDFLAERSKKPTASYGSVGGDRTQYKNAEEMLQAMYDFLEDYGSGNLSDVSAMGGVIKFKGTRKNSGFRYDIKKKKGNSIL